MHNAKVDLFLNQANIYAIRIVFNIRRAPQCVLYSVQPFSGVVAQRFIKHKSLVKCKPRATEIPQRSREGKCRRRDVRLPRLIRQSYHEPSGLRNTASVDRSLSDGLFVKVTCEDTRAIVLRLGSMPKERQTGIRKQVMRIERDIWTAHPICELVVFQQLNVLSISRRDCLSGACWNHVTHVTIDHVTLSCARTIQPTDRLTSSAPHRFHHTSSAQVFERATWSDA